MLSGAWLLIGGYLIVAVASLLEVDFRPAADPRDSWHDQSARVALAAPLTPHLHRRGRMDRRRLLGLVAGVLLAVPVSPVLAAEGASGGHRLVLQVDTNDSFAMNLALNNATAAKEYYSSRHEPVAIEIVTYGPGLHILRADTSPLKTRLAAFPPSMPDERLSCV